MKWAYRNAAVFGLAGWAIALALAIFVWFGPILRPNKSASTPATNIKEPTASISDGFDPNNFQTTCDWLFASTIKAISASQIDGNSIKSHQQFDDQMDVLDSFAGKPVKWKIPIRKIEANGTVELDGYESIGYGPKTTQRNSFRQPISSLTPGTYRQEIEIITTGNPLSTNAWRGQLVKMPDQIERLSVLRAGDFVLMSGVLQEVSTSDGTWSLTTKLKIKDATFSLP